MKTLRSHGFNQRPRFEQVVGYLERNEPLPLDQPGRKATTFVTSHFYLDDFVQSSEDPNPQPLQHTPLSAIPEEGFRTPAEALADVMESYRDSFRAQSGLDPIHYVTLPGAAWDAMLRHSARETPIHLITDEQAYRDVRASVMGGLSCIFQPRGGLQPLSWISYLDFNAMYPAAMTLPMPNGPCVAVALPEDNAARLSWLHETCLSSLNWESDAEEVSYLLLVDYDFPPELHDHLDWAPPTRMKVGKGLYGPHTADMAERLGLSPSPCEKLVPFLGMHVEEGVDGKRLKFLRDVLGARVWRLHRAYRFACSPFMAGFMELKHSERRQLKTAGSVVAEKVVKLTQNAIFGRCCMNPDKFRNTNAYVDPAKFEHDSEGFLAFVETLKTDRKACMSVPTQVGARTLQLSKLMMEKAYYLHMRKLFPKMRLLFTDTDSVMVQIFELQDPLHAMAEANLNGAALFDVAGKSKDPERDLSALSAATRAKAIEVMGQLGKLGDETFPARILEYVGLRSKMYSILTVQPDGARKEKRKIKGVPKKAVTNVRHLEYREVLEEGSERRAAFAQLRSRAHEIAVETVEKKSLSPFNDKVYGLDAHNSRPLGHWRNLEQLRMLGAYAPPGSAPFDLVMEFLVGPPPLGPAPTLPLRLSRCWA